MQITTDGYLLTTNFKYILVTIINTHVIKLSIRFNRIPNPQVFRHYLIEHEHIINISNNYFQTRGFKEVGSWFGKFRFYYNNININI